MANKRDHNYEEPVASPAQPKKSSLKEKHEEAMKHVQNSGLKLGSIEGPSKEFPASSFSVKCKQGHDHVIHVNHMNKDDVSVFSSSQAEDSDPDPEHGGSVKSAIAYLKGKHKHAKSESNDGDD